MNADAFGDDAGGSPVQGFGATYDYRESVGLWFRRLVPFQPQTDCISDARLTFQLHTVRAWPLYALQYLGRPHILYRRRYATTSTHSR